GRILPVQQTDYDFLTEKKIGDIRIDGPLAIDLKSRIAATVRSEKSGIGMKVITNQPALIVYMPPEFPAICFETQNFPDAPNQIGFPSSVLRPGEKYRNASEFKFFMT
ncbi:MAG: galactose mutarotase, partial [Pricia sp.]